MITVQQQSQSIRAQVDPSSLQLRTSSRGRPDHTNDMSMDEIQVETRFPTICSTSGIAIEQNANHKFHDQTCTWWSSPGYIHQVARVGKLIVTEPCCSVNSQG